MRDPSITVNSKNYDGSIRRTWRCEFIARQGPLLTFWGVFDQDIEHSDLGLIKKGTISHEYYWLDRWYNVFRFHESDGTFRNYYCNINMPPTFENGVLDYVDLDIDIVIWPDLSFEILDREEFEQNATKFGLPAEIRTRVDITIAELVGVIERRELPVPD